MNRPRRNRAAVNYVTLNSGKVRKGMNKTEDSEEELDYEDDVVDIHGASRW